LYAFPFIHAWPRIPIRQAGLAEHRVLEENRVRIVGLDLDRRADQPLLHAARGRQGRELAEKALLVIVRHARMVAGEPDAGYQILTADGGNPQELGFGGAEERRQVTGAVNDAHEHDPARLRAVEEDMPADRKGEQIVP
jgi:hypothetical protein